MTEPDRGNDDPPSSRERADRLCRGSHLAAPESDSFCARGRPVDAMQSGKEAQQGWFNAEHNLLILAESRASGSERGDLDRPRA